MTFQPKISVITCLYNTPPELFKECLDGLVSQTFIDFEVLIVNDGSDKYLEENLSIIENYNDNRFKYYSKEHSGKSQTLNHALLKAKGKYIAINDSDDVSYPERLEYQYRFLENNKKYDAISNAMKADPTNIIFPGVFKSGKVNKYDLNYKACHPSMMFNKNKVLNNVPFLFEQIYDSMEDNVFNHIMFYDANIKFYYDNRVLVKYSQKNPDAVHYENTYGYKKEGSFKLFHRTFNVSEFHKNAQMTCILIVNETWRDELEKTILNIRFTSDNVNILVAAYNTSFNEEYYQKYDVKFIYSNTYINALSNGIELCQTEYIFVISKPIRFYVQDWDLHSIRYFECSNKLTIMQPHLIGIEKRDTNNYYNENGKNLYNERCGENLILLDNVLTEKRDHIEYYSEYVTMIDIPIMNDDLIFITTKQEMEKMLYVMGFDNEVLLNVFISLKEYLQGGHVLINTDIKCGVVEMAISEMSEYEYSMNYYMNMWKIAYFFLNESKFIYEKIIHDNVKNIEDAKYIINSVIEDEELNYAKNNYNSYKDMSYFLKNINLKYNIWSLTNAI